MNKSHETIRKQVMEELQCGHLGMAMQLVEDHELPVAGDAELRRAAITAASGSLKRNFHWILPAFLAAFKIQDSVALQQLAYRISAMALAHRQFLLAGLFEQTFGLRFDPHIRALIERSKENLRASISGAGVVVIDGSASEYQFDVE